MESGHLILGLLVSLLWTELHAGWDDTSWKPACCISDLGVIFAAFFQPESAIAVSGVACNVVDFFTCALPAAAPASGFGSSGMAGVGCKPGPGSIDCGSGVGTSSGCDGSTGLESWLSCWLLPDNPVEPFASCSYGPRLITLGWLKP